MADRRVKDSVAISAGFCMYNFLGACTGVQAGAYLTPNTLLEGDLLAAASLLPDLQAVTSFSGGVRHFAGDTFYVKGALRYRNLIFYRINDIIFDPDGIDYTNQKDLGIEGAVGNRWQWGAFILGVEWLTLTYPVLILTTERVFVDGSRKKADESIIKMDVRYLYLQMGASF